MRRARRWNRRGGAVQVIVGSMFSGKTSELIRRLRNAEIARESVMVFRPGRDVRSRRNHIQTHLRDRLEAVTVLSAADVLRRLPRGADVVGIDEAQFFDQAIVGVVKTLRNRGVRVVGAGLNQDFRGEPFGVMGELLALADDITHLKAVCSVCGSPDATKSFRKVRSTEQVLAGGGREYEARCNSCWGNYPEEAGLGGSARSGARRRRT